MRQWPTTPYASNFSSGSDAAYSSICVKIYRGAAGIDPYVSFFIGGQRGAYSSICVNFSRGAARRMQLHMCQFLSRSSRGGYETHMCQFFIEERRAIRPICVEFLSGSGVIGGVYNSICVNFSRGAARRMQLHMCQIIIRGQRDACSSICVNFLSGSAATHAAPYASNFYQGAARRI